LACAVVVAGCSDGPPDGDDGIEDAIGGSIVALVEGDETVVAADDEVAAPTADAPAADSMQSRLEAIRQRIAEARKRAAERLGSRGRGGPSTPPAACDEVELPSCADRLIILDSSTNITLSESPIGKGDDIDPTPNVRRMKAELLERLPDYSHMGEEFAERITESWIRSFDRRIERLTGSEELILVMKACEEGVYQVHATADNVPARYHWRVTPKTLEGIGVSTPGRGRGKHSKGAFELEQGRSWVPAARQRPSTGRAAATEPT
jgi:hypothetical protein